MPQLLSIRAILLPHAAALNTRSHTPTHTACPACRRGYGPTPEQLQHKQVLLLLALQRIQAHVSHRQGG